MKSLIRIQDEKTNLIKAYQINGVEVSEEFYNKSFDEFNRTMQYNSSATKRNIETGDYIHTAIFS
jgi:hypothetical protein